MKNILALALLLQTAVVFAAPTKNEQLEVCTNTKVKTSLKIENIANSKKIVGTLKDGDFDKTLKCDNRGIKSSITGEEVVYLCNETRAGEGTLQIYIYRNVSGVKYASVYRKDIIGRPVSLYAMKCNQQVSN